jgi:hypothetical protein
MGHTTWPGMGSAAIEAAVIAAGIPRRRDTPTQTRGWAPIPRRRGTPIPTRRRTRIREARAGLADRMGWSVRLGLAVGLGLWGRMGRMDRLGLWGCMDQLDLWGVRR